MTAYFLDTGFLVALEAADDQHHAAAIAAWREIRKGRVTFVTTSYVFDEVATFFNSRGYHAKAITIAEAWRDFSHHSDKRYSLTDCVSFAVMKRRRIKKALAFDRHFTQAGFERLP